MKTNTKIVLTSLITGAYFGGMSLWHLIQSPVVGAATAAQLNDTASSYTEARFFNQGGVEYGFLFLLLITLSFVWFFPFSQNNKNNTQ